MAAITVRVTGTDVRRGLPGDPLRCPVARALRRATGRPWSACRQVLQLHGGGEDRKLPSPEEADTFMFAFDRGKDVQPFAFALDVPDGWLTRE
jgi:hypothetical protein